MMPTGESPLRAWLALGAVLAVAATAVALRPAAIGTTAPSGPLAPAPASFLLAEHFHSLVPALSPVAPAVTRTPVEGTSSTRLEPGRTRARHAPIDAHAQRAGLTDEVPPLMEPTPGQAVSRGEAPALNARFTTTWQFTMDAVPSTVAGPQQGSWASRAGHRVGTGFRATGIGLRTGFGTAGRVLRRAF